MSALAGLVLGFYFGLAAIVVSGLILAISAAAILQNEDFDFLAGIAIIVLCLTVNQIAYLIGWRAAVRRTNKISLPGHQPDDDPGDSGHKDIAGEHEEQQKTPLRFVPTSKRWRSFSPDTALGAIVAVPVHLVQRGRMLCCGICAAWRFEGARAPGKCHAPWEPGLGACTGWGFFSLCSMKGRGAKS